MHHLSLCVMKKLVFCIRDGNITKFQVGTHAPLHHFKNPQILVLKYRNCEIFEMYHVTHDTGSVVVRMTSHCRLMVPVGHHVLLRICVNGEILCSHGSS